VDKKKYYLIISLINVNQRTDSKKKKETILIYLFEDIIWSNKELVSLRDFFQKHILTLNLVVYLI